MNVLVIYDSYFGNTENVAKAIDNSFKKHCDSRLVHVNQFKEKDLVNVDLFIVGSPTRAFSSTKNITVVLKKLNSKDFKNLKIAVFDTRVDIIKINVKLLTFLTNIKGYATDTMVKLLQKKGFNVINNPMGFFVEESEGPLRKGEIERAIEWANSLF